MLTLQLANLPRLTAKCQWWTLKGTIKGYTYFKVAASHRTVHKPPSLWSHFTAGRAEAKNHRLICLSSQCTEKPHQWHFLWSINFTLYRHSCPVIQILNPPYSITPSVCFLTWQIYPLKAEINLFLWCSFPFLFFINEKILAALFVTASNQK